MNDTIKPLNSRDITEEERERLDNNFTHHPPFGDQAARYEIIRFTARQLASTFMRFCPPSRELSLALTEIENAVMWANAAIARNEKEESVLAEDTPS